MAPGTGLPVWVGVLTSVLGVPATRRRSGEAASAGAALLAGKALGMGLTLEKLDPVSGVIEPDADAVEVYLGMRPQVDHVAMSVLAATASLPGAERTRHLTPRCASTSPTAATARRSRCPTRRTSSSPSTRRRWPTRTPPSAPRWRRRWRAIRCARLVDGARRVAVVFPDLTRPMPNRTVLPPLLDELARAGVPAERVTLLCATGTHRQATAAEMAELIGPELVARYRVVDHDAASDEHVLVGEVDGVAVLLQREYVEADVRIVTGFVEPHFFAGFSGGPKAVCPGLAATATILEAHHPRRIADERATFLTRHGNPVHDFVRAATALAPPQLSLDVAINRARRVTAVFAGPLTAAHDAACAHVGAAARREVDAPYDLVVSTNGGHPLDRNLYQAVKGMAAADRVRRPGGTVVMAAACADGVPDDGAFAASPGGVPHARRPRRVDGRAGTGSLAGAGAGPRPGAGRGPAAQRRPGG